MMSTLNGKIEETNAESTPLLAKPKVDLSLTDFNQPERTDSATTKQQKHEFIASSVDFDNNKSPSASSSLSNPNKTYPNSPERKNKSYVLPWAFNNLRANLVPSDTESIAHSCITNGADSSNKHVNKTESKDRSNALTWACNDLRANLVPSDTETPQKLTAETRSDRGHRFPDARSELDNWLKHDNLPMEKAEHVSTPVLKSSIRVTVENHPKNHNISLNSRGKYRMKRTPRRRIFLALTQPQSSIFSAFLFIILVIAIFASNVVMLMQTMSQWQYTPDDCQFCSDYNIGYGQDPCVCEPQPKQNIKNVEKYLIWLFTAEWTFRVLCFAPPRKQQSYLKFLRKWLSFMIKWSTLLDALAIFPYYIAEDFTTGFISRVVFRVFRLLQLLRLAQYSETFMSLSDVMIKSLLNLNVLVVALAFCGTLFGTLIFWLEKGEWKYTTYTDPPSYMYMRISADGLTEEPSPFTSIPASFWWFIVTVTTVGYGDVYPVTSHGRIVAGFAMLIGVLVIAFPVSVFSDVWSKELAKRAALEDAELNKNVDFLLQESEGVKDETPDRNNSNRVLKLTSARKHAYSTVLSIVSLDNPTSSVMENTPVKVDRRPSLDNSSDSLGDNSFLEESDKISFSKEDVKALYDHLASIEENQRQIRDLLKRIK